MRYAIAVLALALIIVFLAPPTRLLSQSSKPPEYRTVVSCFVGGILGQGGMQAGIQNALTEQSRAGWEFVSATPTGNCFLLIFKERVSQ